MITRHFLILTLVVQATLATASEGLPVWNTLEYEQKAFWVTATSSVALDPCSGERSQNWCLTAESSVASNRETLTLEAEYTGRLTERKRASVGRERRRIKEWSYSAEGIARRRLEPVSKAADDYQVTSERQLDYPAAAGPVTDAVLLLALAAPGSAPGKAQPFIVQTDLNFYRVTATTLGEESVAGEFVLDGRKSGGPRPARLVQLTAEPIKPLADKPDFSLLGLSGDIVIAFDAATGVPLQLRGRAPRVGEATIDLRRASLRKPAP